MTYADQLIETGSLHDVRSLERRVKYIRYEVLTLRRKVIVLTDLGQIEEIAAEILRLENFQEEFESLIKTL